MLEDFIASNRLQAKILPFPAKENVVKCRLFSCQKLDCLAVFLAGSRLSEEKLCNALGVSSVRPVGALEAEKRTGYASEFMPPVSVYGVKVLVDRKVSGMELVHCPVAEEKALEISPMEIADANEDAELADITV